ncbi:hypothetical protein FA13DRAFT_841571 [Coprinellus micaceus]|uniref:F-box domain-containing protein n=1 Tax=Coprinellus micaceus TaxID=71717 RepID=A0A4Y7T158_COPMI|nr:hypothetical protein FA13DRAFT_841571 [Coprinellus micaceus]
MKHQGRTLIRLEQYLIHSGTRPFTFGFILHHNRPLHDAYVSFAYIVLQRLVRECHRWEGPLLYLARYGAGGKWPVDPLLPIEGHLPALSRLDLTVAAKTNDEWSLLSSPFSSAPKLRHVVFNTPRHGVASANTHFDLLLPWAQLSTFDGLSHFYSHNSLLRFLSQSPSPDSTLTTLKIGSIQIQPPISPPVTLTKLTTLHIQLNSPDGRLWLAAMLVVPSLQSLSMHGRRPPQDTAVLHHPRPHPHVPVPPHPPCARRLPRAAEGARTVRRIQSLCIPALPPAHGTGHPVDVRGCAWVPHRVRCRP